MSNVPKSPAASEVPVARAPRAPRPENARRRPAVPPNPVPPIDFPAALPVCGRREEIARAIRDHQVVIVSGETGSGKTTQLPKICLSLGRGLGAGGSGLIGHTQPRRIAASATGRRIAEELGTPLFVRQSRRVTLTAAGQAFLPEARRALAALQAARAAVSATQGLTQGQLSVGISQVNRYYFTISGNAAKAGVYPSKSYVTVLEALSMAGGPNKYAGSDMYIVRGTPPRRIPINIKELSSGEHPEENLVVLRGDLIVVQ